MSDLCVRVCANASGRVRCPVAVRDWAWRCLFSCKSYSIEHKATAQPYPKIIGRFTDDPAQHPPPNQSSSHACARHIRRTAHIPHAPPEPCLADSQRLVAPPQTTQDASGRHNLHVHVHIPLSTKHPPSHPSSAQHCPPPLATDRAHTKMITTHTLTNTTPRHDV